MWRCYKQFKSILICVDKFSCLKNTQNLRYFRGYYVFQVNSFEGSQKFILISRLGEYYVCICKHAHIYALDD